MPLTFKKMCILELVFPWYFGIIKFEGKYLKLNSFVLTISLQFFLSLFGQIRAFSWKPIRQILACTEHNLLQKFKFNLRTLFWEIAKFF